MPEQSWYFRFYSAYNAFLGANWLDQIILAISSPSCDKSIFPEGPNTLVDDEFIEFFRSQAKRWMFFREESGETRIDYMEAATAECERAIRSAKGGPVSSVVPALKKVILRFVEVLHEWLDQVSDRLPQERMITPDEQHRVFDRISAKPPPERLAIVGPFMVDLARVGLLPVPTKDNRPSNVEGVPRARGSSDAETSTALGVATQSSNVTSSTAQAPPTESGVRTSLVRGPIAGEDAAEGARAVAACGGGQGGEAVLVGGESASAPSGPAPLGTEQDAWLGHAAIARANGVDSERLRKRLDRLRKTNHDCFREVAEGERKPREPRYLYRVSAVDPIVRELKASGGASAQRPAKKS